MYYIFVENGELNGAGEARQLNENIVNAEVSQEIYDNYIDDPLRYIYSNGEIIANPNYETLKQKRENQKRIDEIDKLLKELDEKRIRAVCENEIKDTQTGETWLEYYNSQIETLRLERTDLI